MFELPANTLVDLASDNDLNNAGPVATNEDGLIYMLDAERRIDGRPVVVLWPDQTEMFEDRYLD